MSTTTSTQKSSSYFTTKRDLTKETSLSSPLQQRLFSQEFGDPINANDLFNSHSYRRWPLSSKLGTTFGPNSSLFSTTGPGVGDKGFSFIKDEPTAYQIMLDAHQFTPEELKVKTVDNLLIINAKHEEKEDEHGLISREFTRKYRLTDDVDFENVISYYRSDGVLIVKAPKKVLRDQSKQERVIPVSVTETKNSVHFERQTSSRVDHGTDP